MDQQKHTTEDTLTDIFGSKEMRSPAPTEFIPKNKTAPEIAYQLVKDETYPQTQPRLNLATFVTTYMDDYATRLMNEAININYIDETEYPRVAVMCGRCLNIVANMWNSPEKAEWKTGALGIGSSEACMLGGVAAWLRWRARRKAAGKPFDKPNLVMSTGFQVVWEKFCQLWQIEMRTVPLTLDHPTLDIGEALKACDENTICIVPIAGVTWTGLDDDIEGLDKALDAYNAKTGYEIPIHVDAASGGFILPFLHPEKKWDFRLKWVLSISTSGHKYGLVYPGLGWVVWKDKKYLPDEMSFSVNYLGANITQVESSTGLGIAVKNVHDRMIGFFGPDAQMVYTSVLGEGTQVTLRCPGCAKAPASAAASAEALAASLDEGDGEAAESAEKAARNNATMAELTELVAQVSE